MKADKRTLQQQTTLDSKHDQFMEEFAKDETEIIPELKKHYLKLKKKLKVAKEHRNIEKILDIKDKLKHVQQEIKARMEKKKKYFLDNAKYIFEYFDNKKNIATEDSATTTATTTPQPSTAVAVASEKKKILLDFFKINSETPTEFLKVSDAQKKSCSIVQKYLYNIDTNYIDMDTYIYPADICRNCNHGEMIPSEIDGNVVCDKCHYSVPFFLECEKPSYKEPPKEVCFYSYKRINHFKEIIAQIQGKETTQIPSDVFDDIRQQAKKERIPLSDISYVETREILRKLGYNKYYEHIPFILSKFGIEPPLFPADLEETLFNLFIEIQHPFSKYCPADKFNFLNYYYTGYKLIELLGEYQFLPFFPMLKDPEKRNEQDAIWKNICNEYDWEFIPTP
jgi:hypothetical protein